MAQATSPSDGTRYRAIRSVNTQHFREEQVTPSVPPAPVLAWCSSLRGGG